MGDDLDESADMDTMLARLAERLGIDTSDIVTDEDQPSTTDSLTEVKTDLFGLKGGSN